MDSTNQQIASCRQNNSFEVGITLLLLQHPFGIIGEGIVIESSLIGHWRRMDILQGSKSFVLVYPIQIFKGADSLPTRPL
jgi:hypothetical protein